MKLLSELFKQYEIIYGANTNTNKDMINYEKQLIASFPVTFLKKEEVIFDENIVKLVTKKFIQTNGIIPLRQANNIYTIGISDFFLNNQVINYLNIKNYHLVIIDEATIKHIVNLVYGNEVLNQILMNLEEQPIITNEEKEEEMINLAPIVQLVESILNEAINLKASDIHLEPLETMVNLRMRLDGLLVVKSTFDKKISYAIITRIKIMAGMDITNKRLPQDGKIRYEFKNVIYDCRISTMPTINGEKIVIRILDKSRFNFTRKELGFTIQDNEKISTILNSPYGLLLLTGPTGCGKSTTLYSFIQELNDNTRNIVTVEDPVEYTISGVNQIQVHHQINLSFKEIIRSLLRQDPDIMMIGEIRDEETAQMAIRSAITGHFVMATLHTNQALGVITRLVDMGIPHYLIAEAIKGVIAQRLVRKVCHYCSYLRPP